MKRRFAIACAWCAALLLLWPFTSISGLAGNPLLGNKIAEEVETHTRLPRHNLCSTALINWTLATTRARIAYDQITKSSFRAAAQQARDLYASKNCPAGAFLIAGRIAHDHAVRIRENAGMGQAHLHNRLW